MSELPEWQLAGVSRERWLDLQEAYNSGAVEPEEGTVEDRVFRRMDAVARAETARSTTAAFWAGWAAADPEAAAFARAEAKARVEASAEPADPWAEAGL